MEHHYFKKTSQTKHFLNQQLGNHKKSSDLFSIRKQQNDIRKHEALQFLKFFVLMIISHSTTRMNKCHTSF